MNIEDLTLKQVKELQSLFLKNSEEKKGLNQMIGEKVIVRTYSAGVWFGVLSKKDGNEVILSEARRMWSWWAAKSISLSGCAVYGIIKDKSKIAPKVNSVWLEAIEITPCTTKAAESIEGAIDAEAQ